MYVEVIASQKWDVFETRCRYVGRVSHLFCTTVQYSLCTRM